MELVSFFSPERVVNALDKYHQCYVEGRGWSLGQKITAYNDAKIALSQTKPLDLCEHAFIHVYNTLELFGVSRGKYVSMASWMDTLGILKEQGASFKKLTLSELCKLDAEEVFTTLEPLLIALAPTKIQSSGDYPWVLVSKLLHFCNPKLFPIFDQTYIQNKALCRAFDSERKAFWKPRVRNWGEKTYAFNINYCIWASSFISPAAESVMPIFSSWFKNKLGAYPDPEHTLDELQTYEATTFEFVLLGAAALMGFEP